MEGFERKEQAALGVLPDRGFRLGGQLTRKCAAGLLLGGAVCKPATRARTRATMLSAVAPTASQRIRRACRASRSARARASRHCSRNSRSVSFSSSGQVLAHSSASRSACRAATTLPVAPARPTALPAAATGSGGPPARPRCRPAPARSAGREPARTRSPPPLLRPHQVGVHQRQMASLSRPWLCSGPCNTCPRMPCSVMSCRSHHSRMARSPTPLPAAMAAPARHSTRAAPRHVAHVLDVVHADLGVARQQPVPQTPAHHLQLHRLDVRPHLFFDAAIQALYPHPAQVVHQLGCGCVHKLSAIRRAGC